MPRSLTRRQMLRDTTLAAGLASLGGVWTDRAAARSQSPNDKLNIACIACGGMGASDLNAVSSENIVALCDVDDARAADAYKRYPNVPHYRDFRRMLDKEGKRIDAVTVSTPDHTHAVASVMAMRMGKHVYCQKPLCHSVSEARTMLRVAREKKLATQMGTQGHPTYFRLVELIQSGVIGQVQEVHAMSDRPIWPQGMTRPTDTPPVPATLDWDLWLGPAKERPYHPAYLPFVWRGWWDFGTGALGDMACHILDGAFWALKLADPLTVEAEADVRLPDAGPNWSIVTWRFGARGSLAPVKVVWYDGGKTIPAELLDGVQLDKGFNGSLFVGEKGRILQPHGGAPRLLPESEFKDYQGPEPFLPRYDDHYRNWIDACKSGGPTGSHFGYAAPMTEAILLGVIALRVPGVLEWDARGMRFRNSPVANRYVRHDYRKGWTL